jgi:hypothetical protein
MLQRLSLTLAILGVAGYGVAEGLWSQRWFPPAELRRAQEKLDLIPRTVGPWEGEDRELDPRQARQGEISAGLSRVYVNPETGAALSVLLVAGRAGPICVHTPEVCLGGGGFALTAPANRVEVEADAHSGTFWRGVFRKGEALTPEEMEVYWSWNSGSGWRAVSSPRWDLARERMLYKLYVTRGLGGPGAREDEESPIPGFLKRFLPEVQRALFTAP